MEDTASIFRVSSMCSETLLPICQMGFMTRKNTMGKDLEVVACGLFESKNEENHLKYQSTPTEFNVKPQYEFSP
jgi:hypothetical protein